MKRSSSLDPHGPDHVQFNQSTEGDRQAWDFYYDLYHPAIITYSEKFMSIQQDAEDLVQEVFFKLWRDREKMVSGDHVRNFLFQVTRNGALDRLRNKMMEKNKLDGYRILMSRKTAALESMGAELLNYVYHLLRRLPEKEREVVKWSLIYKFSVEEIAELHKVSVETVKSQKRAGIKKLRAMCTREELTKLFLVLSLVANEGQVVAQYFADDIKKVEKNIDPD